MNKFIITSINDINKAAEDFIKIFNKPAVFCFYGSMGAGKTTFIQALCSKLNVIDVVNSPTFAIVNEYATDSGDEVFHFDFYRLKDEDEAYDLGYENYFYSGSYCFVEWPEKIFSLLPENRYDVKITVQDDDSRIIEVSNVNSSE